MDNRPIVLNEEIERIVQRNQARIERALKRTAYTGITPEQLEFRMIRILEHAMKLGWV